MLNLLRNIWQAARPHPAPVAKSRSTWLACERLESRELMANDVTAFVDSTGVLHIYGDVVANTVKVTRSAAHSYVVAGDWAGSGAQRSPTMINGRNQAFQADHVAHIVAHLGHGNDSIVIGAGHFGLDGRPDLHNITVNMGTGQSEYVRIGGFDVTGHVDVNAGNGAATVHLLNSHLQSATINTGNGNDRVEVDVTTVAHTLAVNTRGGNDLFHLDNENANSKNYRRVGELRADLGSGKDRMELYEVVVDRIFADLGEGDDHLQLGFAELRSGRTHAQAGHDSWWHTAPNRGAAGQYGFEINVRR